MKNFTFKRLAIIAIAFFAATSVFAQEKAGKTQDNSGTHHRCYTMEALKEMIEKDPTLPAKWKADGERMQRENAARQLNPLTPNSPNTPTSPQAITVIPIVFHIVGTAANQAFVTDQLIQRQVDVLNRDFAGRNPDSTKLPAAFKALFGHSEIQFCLAKRTPTNTTTNGIERLVTAQTYTAGTVSSLKHSVANGGTGLDQWDGTKYFNVWVANFTDGLLGIATFPFMTPANEQGVAIHYGSIDQPCGSPFAGSFDGGRTLVHEAGHYFYLYHIWGDNTDCNDQDFRIQAGFPLAAGCTDDTPNQAGPTSGCLSGIVNDACSPTVTGKMYQNYMDYTDDGCYGLFTTAQVCRIQSCVDLYRASLKTSNGCVPVTAVNNDVRVSEILNPNSRGFACGVNATFCGNLTPQVLIVNDGDAALTSLTFTIKIDGATVATQNWTGNLAPADYAYVNINPFSGGAGGVHILTIRTNNPNGAADGRPNSDSAQARYTAIGTFAIPHTQDFEPAAATFPPTGWIIDNPDGARTWAKRTGVTGPTGASTSCMWLDAANYGATGQIDRFRTGNIDLTGVDSIKMSWNLAKTYWPGFTTDSLQIVYSTDCGITWKNAGYNRGGTTFITAPPQASDFVPSSAAQWISESIALGTCGLPTNNIMLGFQFRNGFGNNIFIDNINITKVNTVSPNAGVLNIVQPSATLCGTTFTPVVTIGNFGTGNLTSVTINYRVDNGTVSTFNWTGSIAKCNSANVTLNPITSTAGNHILTVYTTNPNGSPDLAPANDTARKSFSISPQIPLPISEGFENAAFPPANWSLQNPGGSVTWARTTTAARSGSGAMWLNSPTNAVSPDVDRIFTPVLTNSSSYDSVFVSWDYSYIPGVQYPGGTAVPMDTLEVLVTTNCGATFKTIWKKWGEDLQTIEDPNLANNPSFIPTQAGEWKNNRVFLNPFVGTSNFQVYFVAKSNKQNNIWVDNINIYTKTLPARLKNQGYLLYPNPFTSSIRLHHWVRPADLQSVQVYNSIGELVWDKRFNGDANTEMNIDMVNLAAGVYVVKLTYSSKTIIERILKQ